MFIYFFLNFVNIFFLFNSRLFCHNNKFLHSISYIYSFFYNFFAMFISVYRLSQRLLHYFIFDGIFHFIWLQTHFRIYFQLTELCRYIVIFFFWRCKHLLLFINHTLRNFETSRSNLHFNILLLSVFSWLYLKIKSLDGNCFFIIHNNHKSRLGNVCSEILAISSSNLLN